MGEFTRSKLQKYHISPECAHLMLVRSCICYLSICLERAGGLTSPGASNCCSAGVPSQPITRLHPKSQPLLDYALDGALDHFAYLGSIFKSALHDVSILARDIQRHSWIWDHVCIPTRQEIDIRPRWPAARHDLLLYILVAFAPNSFMITYLRRNALNPKKGTNPLVYAAQFNKDEHAHTLLLRGARLHQRGWETSGFRQSLPIEVAFWNRHYAMVTHFVEEGSTIPPHIFTDSFFRREHLISQMIPIARVLLQSDDFAENINNCLHEPALHAMKTSNQLLVFKEATEQDLIAIIRRFVQIADERLTHNFIKETFLRFAIAQGYLSAACYLFTLGTPLPSDILITLHRLPGRWKTVPTIRFLVDNGADVLVRTSSGDSVLHAMLWGPDENCHWMIGDADGDEDDILEATKLLVVHGCDHNGSDSRGNTPLHIAVKRGYVSVARYLLTLDAPVPDDLLVTLDNHSCWSTAMIRLLFENGANVLARTSGGASALHIALQSLSRSLHNDNGTLETVELLVDYGCDPLEASPLGNTPFQIAVECGHISVARYLLSLGAHVPPDLLVTLDYSRWGWKTVPMIHFLVENGASALVRTNSGDSVLHMMLRSSYYDNTNLEVVKVLVGYGCDPMEADFQGNTPLHIAVDQGYISTAQYLLALGAPLLPDLLVTSRPGRRTTHMIRFLIENGVDILARTRDEDPVIHVALRSLYSDNEALETVKLLAGYGCDPLKADFQGNTPLSIAIGKGHVSTARYLFTLGAPLPSNLLVTLKHNRLYLDSVSTIRFLVESGVDPLARTSDGASLLHIVLQSLYDDDDALEAVKLLVEHGCDPIEANFGGDTPLHIAVKKGHISAARYLLNLGAALPPDLLVAKSQAGSFQCNTTYMTRFLLENGVDALTRASNGDSVIHVVLQSMMSLDDDEEILEIVKILVDHGCDPFEAGPHGNTPLHVAVKQGYISVARYLLTLGAPLPPDLLVTLNHNFSCRITTPIVHFLVGNGVDIRAHASNGNSLLHIAVQCFQGNHDALGVVKLLVGYGCDPLEANPCGNTPLHFAIGRGYIPIAQYLLTLGAHLPPDFLVTRTLDYLIWSPPTRIIRFLIENGVNVLAQNSDEDSVLHNLLQLLYDDETALEVVEALVGYGCDPLHTNIYGKTPLHIAIERGHISVTRYLLTLGSPLPRDLLVTLNHNISRWGTIPMVRFLVENGVDVLAHASNGDSAIHIVLQCLDDDENALETVKLLVSYGCDPLGANACGITPLHFAIEQGYVSVAQYLLTLGAHLPPDLLVTRALGHPTWSQCTHLICFLVESGTNVLAQTNDEDSVLHNLLQLLQDDEVALEAVKALVGYGCDPLHTNIYGKTPLHIAVERGHISVVRYLLTLGASVPPDVLVTSNLDRSQWSTVTIVRFLVENGVDVLAHTRNGDCAIHIALRCFNRDGAVLEVVKRLIAHGCDPLHVNAHGKTPLHIAVEQGHITVARYLLTLGAPLPPDLLVTLDHNFSCWSTTPMVRFLVENGVDVVAHASNGDSTIHIALRCLKDDRYVLEAVKLLVGHGCDPLEANSLGEVPLHIAAAQGYIPIAQYLIAQGASVQTKASNGDTVLHFATGAVRPDPDYDYHEDWPVLEAVKFFVRCGCQPAVCNDAGKTPLHNAVHFGRIRTIKYLLSLNILLPPDILFTATHSEHNSACCRYIVETLVTSGCDTWTPNSDGDTPLQAAIIKGKVDVVDYLLSVVPVLNHEVEDLFSAITLAPRSVQIDMRRVLSRLTRAESPVALAMRRGPTRYS